MFILLSTYFDFELFQKQVLTVLVLFILVMFLPISIHSQANTDSPKLPRESAFVGTSELESIKEYNNIGVGGNLNITLPLLNVPGKLGFPLNLSYTSGIKLDQTASWVGLGWNLGSWSVKRIPVQGDDTKIYDYEDKTYDYLLNRNVDYFDNIGKETRVHVNDVYQVNMPGRSVKFMNVGTLDKPKFVSMSNTRDSLFVAIDSVLLKDSLRVDPNGPDVWVPSDPPNYNIPRTNPGSYSGLVWYFVEYLHFILVDENGTRFVFNKPMKQSAIGNPPIDMYETNPDFSSLGWLSEAIENEWLLTEILSFDYLDTGGDPLDPSDSEGNYGDWIKFDYAPNEVLYMKEYECNDEIYPSYDTTYITHLSSIETKTLIVDFDVKTLKDYKSIRYYRSHDGANSERVKEKVLSKIYAKDKFTDKILNEITFNYESGDLQLKTQWHKHIASQNVGSCTYSGQDGEATLKSVVFGTDNITSYVDGTLLYNNQKYDNGHTLKYSFDYDRTLESSAMLFPGTLPYSSYSAWLNGSEIPERSFIETADPGIASLMDQSWLEANTIYGGDPNNHIFHDQWGHRDFFGYHYDHPYAWSMTKLTTPDGLEFSYEYEKDAYRMTEYLGNTYNWSGGGSRVKSIISNPTSEITSNIGIDKDNAKEYIINLEYGIDKDGFGYPNSMPGNFYSYLSQYSTYISSSIGTREYLSFLSDNVSHLIQYPKITWELGELSEFGEVEYSYITSDSIGPDSLYTMTYTQNQGNFVGIMRYGFFSDRSALLGTQYKTVKYKFGNEVYSKEKFYTYPSIVAKPYDSNDGLGYGTPFIEYWAGTSGQNVESLFKSYFLSLDSIIEKTDIDEISAITNKTHFRYRTDINDNWDYRNLMKIEKEFNGNFSSTFYSYAYCPGNEYLPLSPNPLSPNSSPQSPLDVWCPFDATNEYRNRHLIGLVEAVHVKHEFDFMQENIYDFNIDANSNGIYLSEEYEWIDLNFDNIIGGLSVERFLKREVLLYDRLGNPLKTRDSEGIITQNLYTKKGQIASFVNLQDNEAAFMNAEPDIYIYPSGTGYYFGWNNVNPVKGGFTGDFASSFTPDAIDTLGPNIDMGGVPSNTYIAECWAYSKGINILKIGLDIREGVVVNKHEEARVSVSNQWQRIVCTLEVASTDVGNLICYIASSNDDCLIDDARVYPIDCMVSSWTYDGLLRETSSSGYNNIPTKTYYNGLGDVMVQTDYENSPIAGSEKFYKTSESQISSFETAGKYRRDIPNVIHSFISNGKGLVENFDNNFFVNNNYTITGFGQPITVDQKLLLQTTNNAPPINEYKDILIPVANFKNGFVVFDFDEIVTTGVTSFGETNPIDRTNLRFGIETNSGAGYYVCFANNGNSNAGKFYIIQYDDNAGYADNTLPTSTTLVEIDTYGEWTNTDGDGKRRLMLGLMDNSLYVFYNNECIYRHILESPIPILGNFNNIKFRMKNSAESYVDTEDIWIDNIIFYNDPSIKSDFINAHGLVKQTQSYDGDSIIVSGTSYTIDSKVEAIFKPISIPIANFGSPAYGEVGSVTTVGTENPFDYIDKYLESSYMYGWDIGNCSNNTSYIYSYYNNINTPDCSSGTDFYPFSQIEYENNPLRRTLKTRAAGLFYNNPVTTSYKKLTSSGLPDFGDDYNWGQSYQIESLDENNNLTVSYNDASGQLFATRFDPNGIDSYTMFFKDNYGNDTLVVQPEGQEIRRKFNNLGQMVYDSSGDYGVNNYLYNQKQQLRFKVTASSINDSENPYFLYYKYDQFGRLIEEGLSSDLTILDDYWNNANIYDLPIEGTPLAEITSEYQYDNGEFGRGRLTKSINYPSFKSNSSASWEEYNYDIFGRIVQNDIYIDQIDTSLPKSFITTYNRNGSIERITYPDGNQVAYGYNNIGQMIGFGAGDLNLPSGVTTAAIYNYWPTGLVKQKSFGYPSTVPIQTIDYKYNCRDWLLTINDGNVTTSNIGDQDHFSLQLTYEDNAYCGFTDALTGDCIGSLPSGYYNGNISSYRLKVSPGTNNDDYEQKFAYDNLNRLASTQYSSSEPLTDYTYDKNGNIISVTKLFEQNPHTYNYYNGPSGNKSNRLEYITTTGVANPLDMQYTPSGSLNLYSSKGTNISYNHKEEITRRAAIHRYDPIMDPTTPESDSSSVDYYYNSNGDRILKDYHFYYLYECGSSVIDPEIPLNDYSSIDLNELNPSNLQKKFSLAKLDDNSKEKISVFNNKDIKINPIMSKDMLALFIIGPPPGIITYCTTDTRVLTGYYYNNGQVMSEYEGPDDTDLLENYVYVNGERVASFSANANDTRYYLNDHLGSTVATIDGTGTVKNKHYYRPYGEMDREVIADADKHYNYTGKERDQELSLEWTYFGARYYDPYIKRFMSIDPQHAAYPGWSPYTYTLDNPIKYVDPDGEFVETAVDVVSVGFSASDMYSDPSWANAGWLALDIAALALPFVPAVGAVRHVDDIAKLGNKALDFIKGGDKAGDVGKKVEGIYEFTSTSGKKYVGQSGDVEKRINQHIKNGNVSPKEAAKAKRTKVGGGKTKREIAEQKRIDELGGVEVLKNKRNPIGKNRRHLMSDPK